MAKPKGGTLAALWEVSDTERRDFFERIQKRTTAGTPTETGIPDSSTPVSGVPGVGIPFTGPPVTGIPFSKVDELEPRTGPHEYSGIPDTGTPDSRGSAARMVRVPVTGIPISKQRLGEPLPGVPVTGIPITPSKPGRKIRRATQVQDGHSLGEHLVLTTLWKDPSAVPVGQTAKQITIGYRTLSDKCRLTVNNCKANLRSLQQKLAIEAISAHSNSQATTYLVYDFSAIMRRREAAGLTHVIRSKGCVFVHPETGEAVPVSGTPPVQNLKKEGAVKERSSSASPVISAAAAQLGIIFDDDAVLRLAQRCREREPSATDEEIAHFLQTKVHQLKRSQTIGNWVGLLIASVPEYFHPEAPELQRFRAAKAADEATGREAHDQLMAEARIILDDPDVSESEKAMARTWLMPAGGSA